MKKIIAIVMALTMMMAITVPVFAAEITNESADKTSTVDVKTTFNENSDWSYTVTIPAGVEIAWNDKTEKDMTYSVESQLLIGASLDISAVADNNGEMTAGADVSEKLKFNVTGGGVVNFKEINAANTTAPGVVGGKNVKVAIESFESKPVGVYVGTLTFTVVYNAPTNA